MRTVAAREVDFVARSSTWNTAAAALSVPHKQETGYHTLKGVCVIVSVV